MRKCSQMPYHIGVVLKLHLSYANRRHVAVNAGAERSIYNFLVWSGNEIYRMKKTAKYVPVYRERIAYLEKARWTRADIVNAKPYLEEDEIDSDSIDNGIKAYRTAWKNQKERHCGVPTFHRKSYEQVYHTNSHYDGDSTGLEDGSVRFCGKHHIILPKMGKVRCDGSPTVIRHLLDHPEQTRIGTVTIRRDAVGEYWCTLQISSEFPFRDALEKTGSMAGIDLNLLALVNDSDGCVTVNPRFRSSVEPKIKKLQRSLSRKQEHAKADGRPLIKSGNYQKNRRKLAALHRRVAREREDYLNVTSKRLVESQDLIAAEDLKVKNMLKNHHLAKAISDAGWRTLLTQLQQKADMYGKTVVLIPPRNTTQTCSACGYVMKGDLSLTLADREWTCPNCGTHHDRDQNAAQNILDKGLAILKAKA